MIYSTEWIPLTDVEINSQVFDIRVDTRDFKCMLSWTDTGKRLREDNEIPEESEIKTEEIKDFLFELKKRSTLENLLWWTSSNLKYIQFTRHQEMWMVADRYGNPMKWREI